MRIVKLDRGPYHFDRWEAPDEVVNCALGAVPLILVTETEAEPDKHTMEIGSELVAYVAAHDRELLDLICGHYNFASEDGWLEFCKVPKGLQRDQILNYVDGIEASVHSSEYDYSAGILVKIRWDQQHKLDFTIEHGKLTEINESERWHLDTSGVLRLDH